MPLWQKKKHIISALFGNNVLYLYFYVEEKFPACYHHLTMNQAPMVSLEQQADSLGKSVISIHLR